MCCEGVASLPTAGDYGVANVLLMCCEGVANVFFTGSRRLITCLYMYVYDMYHVCFVFTDSSCRESEHKDETDN